MNVSHGRGIRQLKLVLGSALSLLCSLLFVASLSATDAIDHRRPWWSWQPLVDPVVPAFSASSEGWVPNGAIDHFVAARLAAQSLAPSPQADRRTLIRRLHFDLTGLPPSPEDVARFAADPAPDAYERLVDRLLASPAYGERWARHWLDVVKYADTCGYDKDKLRPHAWPYRDYVIRSFNDDKPYSRFICEQLAGDVLYPGQPDAIVALGFIAAGPWDFIGHVEVPESKIDGRIARHLDRDEMLTNTLNTFCSVTVQCARCHDHKFDPITQHDYYSGQSIFAAVDRADRPYDRDVDIARQRQRLTVRLEQLQTAYEQVQKELTRRGGERLAAAEAAVSAIRDRPTGPVGNPAYGYHSQFASQPDSPKWVQVDLGTPQAIRRVVLRPTYDDFGGIGGGFGFPVRFRVEVALDAEFTEKVRVIADRSETDFANPGLTPVAFECTADEVRYVRITATRLAPRVDTYIFAIAELQVFDAGKVEVASGREVTAFDSIEAPVRWQRRNLVDGIWPGSTDDNGETLEAVVARRDALLASLETAGEAQDRKQLAGEIAATEAARAALPAPQLVYAAATHFAAQANFKPTGGSPRPVHLLTRGNILQPVAEVGPAMPAVGSYGGELEIAPQHSEGDRRAALARWIVDRDNPLTWRSIANRLWLYHFGRGLVDTPNDFGRMGAEPTHPQLLDWLAVRIRDGESVKQIHRRIVTSTVYRQMSARNADNAAVDEGNRYLWRMNRRRLEAEEIRDAILAVSGRLDRRQYGPGFYLFKLEKTDHSPHYEYHLHDPNDRASHRRSVYRFIARSQPNPFMTTLDCADSSQSTPKRNETLTPLQALSLLNNRFMLVMAEHFATRLEAGSTDIEQAIDRATWLVAGRPPTAAELEPLSEYAAGHGLPNACRVLFNLSEFIFID